MCGVTPDQTALVILVLVCSVAVCTELSAVDFKLSQSEEYDLVYRREHNS